VVKKVQGYGALRSSQRHQKHSKASEWQDSLRIKESNCDLGKWGQSGCLFDGNRESEEFSKGVRLEMLAAAYGSKWTFPQSLSIPCTPQPFRPHASSSSFQIKYLLSVLKPCACALYFRVRFRVLHFISSRASIILPSTLKWGSDLLIYMTAWRCDMQQRF
jgi:hypothetical protein